MRRRNFLALAGASAGLTSAGLGASQAQAGSAAIAKPPAKAGGDGTEQETVPFERRVPIRWQADVAVIGGGMAGVSAACAAAKSGAKVVLVERFAVTGGVLTTGGVANFCGQMTGQGEVFDGILKDLRAWGALGEGGRASVFHYEILAIVLQEMLLRRGVKLLLHTRLADVRHKDGRITECLLAGKSGLEALRAKQFIDTTGEADVARAAGFATAKGGRVGGYQLPMSMMYFVRHVAARQTGPHRPKGWFHPIRTKAGLPMTSIWPDGAGGNAIKIKIPMFDSTDTEGLTAAEIRGRRRMMEVLDYHQRVEKRTWRLDHCSPIIGIREGCRVVGDYVLTVADLRAGREFDDAIARGTFYLDGHKPDDDKRTYILPKDKLKVPPYQIPLRCLIARDGKNLLTAGRSLSADQLALSSARVSTTGSMTGQAAGIAAAMAAAKKCDVRDLEAKDVRAIVERRGAKLAVR